VCRQIHEETALLPFSLNTFWFLTVKCFRKLGQKLSAKQRGAIRSIHLYTWGKDKDDVDTFLAAMEKQGSSFEDICPHVQEIEAQVACVSGGARPTNVDIFLLLMWTVEQKRQKRRFTSMWYNPAGKALFGEAWLDAAAARN
jgi:hypothetical protein